MLTTRNEMKNITNLFRRFTAIVVVLFVHNVCAQEIVVEGNVLDPTGLPLLGVSVMEENTTNGTVTGMDGEFSLRLNSDANNLVFSYTGMKTQIIPINGRSNFQISMEEDQLALEEVVVVGYGTTRKINLT